MNEGFEAFAGVVRGVTNRKTQEGWHKQELWITKLFVYSDDKHNKINDAAEWRNKIMTTANEWAVDVT